MATATSDKKMNKIIEIILILLLPPLAVWYHAKACTVQVLHNTILLIFFWLPATIHAIWFCYMRDRMNSAA